MWAYRRHDIPKSITEIFKWIFNSRRKWFVGFVEKARAQAPGKALWTALINS